MTRDLTTWGRLSGRTADILERATPQDAYARLIRATLRLQPGDRVLDLGCGTGMHLSTLRDAVGPDGHVDAIDYSPKMVAKAAARAEGWANVQVRQADATTVDLAPESYDAVLASFSISATQDVPGVVDTIHRTLKPGGRLFAPDMHLVGRGPLTWAFGQVYRLLARWTGVDVLTTIRDRFGAVTAVDGDGVPLTSLPRFAPVLMITATKAG